MSVHQTTPSELGTENSTSGYGPLSATLIDERGTPPVRLDPIQTIRLRLMFLTSPYLRMANEEMKNMLFTHPFEVFLGTNQQNILKETFKETIINEYWMKALRKIHDWLIQFGVAPYRIRPMKFPSITPQFDIGAFQKARAKKPHSSPSFSPSEPKKNKEFDETDDGRNEEKKDKTKSIRIPEVMMVSPESKKVGSSSNANMKCVSYGEEVHNIVDVPDFDCGFVSTYTDSNFKQQFLWTWNPNAVPQTFDNRNGYTDSDVKFIVKDPPTIKGEYTCPLRTSIKGWIYLNSRKKMDSLSMRDRLNPVIFVEKQEPHAMKTPSVIDELSVNYSSSFNSGQMNYRPPGTSGLGLDPNTGEMNLGFGKSVKFDTTRIDGMTDVGLTTYSDGYGGPQISNAGPDYATLVSTLEFNRRATGVGLNSGGTSVPFGFGGINDDELTTDLGGLMTTFGSDPIMTNPMSGIGYRVKKMNEGEKIVEIKNNELNAYVNGTTIEQQERALEEDLCFLAGYPAAFITGRSGGKKGGGGKSGGGSGGKSALSSSSPETISTTSSFDNDTSKGFLIGRLRHFKVYYQQQIAKLFLKCYSETFMKSKIKLLDQLDENHWFILEQVYALKVDLPVDPPPMDSGGLMNYFGSGMVTAEEVIRNTRLNLGLSLDVMDDEEFMARAKKKLENKYDTESQLKLQQKYATKPEGSKGASGGGGKKRKATPEAKKKGDGKKAKR